MFPHSSILDIVGPKSPSSNVDQEQKFKIADLGP